MIESRHEYFKRRLRELGLYDTKNYKRKDYNNIGLLLESLSLVYEAQEGTVDDILQVWNQLMDEWKYNNRAEQYFIPQNRM